MPVPVVRVRLGFGSAPDAPVQEWTDVSAYVRLTAGVTWSRGRSDEQSDVEPGRASVTLDNSDGRFTWGNASSPYYPHVVPGIRMGIDVGASADALVAVFDGYIDGFPVAWASPLANQAWVQIQATDRLARFGKLRPLRDPLAEELGTATSAEDGWWLGGVSTVVQDVYPSETSWPGEDVYPGEA